MDDALMHSGTDAYSSWSYFHALIYYAYWSICPLMRSTTAKAKIIGLLLQSLPHGSTPGGKP